MQRNAPEWQQNLADLQTNSLWLMCLAVLSVGSVWFVYLVWPGTGEGAPALAWASCLALLLGACAALWLRTHLLPFASALFVCALWAAVALAVLAHRSVELTYLFLIPMLFGGVLLGQRPSLALAVGACLFASAAHASVPLLPVFVILMVATASWLSVRNLRLALEWVWSGYESAHSSEQLAQQQQGELRRTLKALDDATYRLERANQMLGVARDQAEEARRLKQQFAQTISHELRTPLNLIVGFTELMAHSPEYYGGVMPPSYMRDLAIVHRNASHLQNLVNDVLDLARIEAAELGLLLEEAQPQVIIQEAVSTARSLVETKGLALHVDLDLEGGLPALWVDSTRIRQVLFNLLNNAVRFTEHGSITISARREGEQVRFAVGDTGVGIAEQDLQRIFEEFEQVETGTRRRHEGAGLGLAISRRFVELHGGRIWAESTVGRGSTFHFTIPCGHQGVLDLADLAGIRGTTARVAPNAEGILLLVTQSNVAATILGRYVHGRRTIIVKDLEQARSVAMHLLPQEVLIDTAQASLSAGALQALAKAWRLEGTLFLAAPMPCEAIQHDQLAADGYILKPVTREALWDVLRPLGSEIDSVLVIDDDRDFVRLMSRLLDNPVRRHQVTSADSGRKALEIFAHAPPDLVLLDLGLPDMDGAEVARQIRANPAWDGVKIVVVSARDEMSTIGPLPEPLIITRPGGLSVGDLVGWLQTVIDPRTAGAARRDQSA